MAKLINREGERQLRMDRETHRETDKQTDEKTDGQTDRQLYVHVLRYGPRANKSMEPHIKLQFTGF